MKLFLTVARMNIYVLGSNSFSGSHFVNFLLNRGHNVWGASRSMQPDEVFLPYKTNYNIKNFQFLKRDLNHDSQSIARDIIENKISYVINFAAQGMVAESWENPDHWYETNFVGTVKLHDQLRKISELKNYLHVSTPEVYGSVEGSVNENCAFNPSTPYAVSRAACDMSLKIFHTRYNFPVTFTRAANVYGPGQQLYRIIPKTFVSILKGKKLQLHGGGTSVRSFIHIRDVCSATERILLNARAPSAYHISTSEMISIRDLVEKICHLMGKPFQDCVEIVGERPGKDKSYSLNSSKLSKEFSWSPEINLDIGLLEYKDWALKNTDKLMQLPDYYEHKK